MSAFPEIYRMSIAEVVQADDDARAFDAYSQWHEPESVAQSISEIMREYRKALLSRACMLTGGSVSIRQLR